MENLKCDMAAGLSVQGGPPRPTGEEPSAVLPVWLGRRFVDLVTDSLYVAAGRDRDALYRLMAHAIVQHLVAEVEGGDSRRLAEEAMHRVLSHVSKDLHHQVVSAKHGQAPVL